MGNAIGFPLCVGLGMVTGAIVAYVQDRVTVAPNLRKHVGLLDMVTDGDHTFGESPFATFLVTSFPTTSTGSQEQIDFPCSRPVGTNLHVNLMRLFFHGFLHTI